MLPPQPHHRSLVTPLLLRNHKTQNSRLLVSSKHHPIHRVDLHLFSRGDLNRKVLRGEVLRELLLLEKSIGWWCFFTAKKRFVKGKNGGKKQLMYAGKIYIWPKEEKWEIKNRKGKIFKNANKKATSGGVLPQCGQFKVPVILSDGESHLCNSKLPNV